MDISAISMVEDMPCRIQVLLVDHETNVHEPIIDMLEQFFLKVTTVKFASTALAILARGDTKFDLIMENIHSPDACGYKLLKEAVQINLPVVLLFKEDDAYITKIGLEAGALLCLKKPINMEVASYLWQLVLWEKKRLIRKQNHEAYNNNGGIFGDLNLMISERANSEEIQSNITTNVKCSTQRVTLKGKVWTEWTQELHDRFMVAVTQLGEGRCYPKDILELMDVPGLTRMQVASHLQYEIRCDIFESQKCRHGSWVPPSKRRHKIRSGANYNKRICRGSRYGRKFGLMPTSTSLTNFNIPQIHHKTSPNEYSSSSGENMVFDMEPQDSKGSIPFPHLGFIKSEHVDWGVDDLGLDGFDAHSVTNASPNQTDCFDEFPSVDSFIQSFSAFDEVTTSYNEVPVMNNADMEKLEKTSKNGDGDDDGKIQVVVKKEEEN